MRPAIIPLRPTVVITPWHPYSMMHSLGGLSSAAYAATNRALYIPFRLTRVYTPTNIFWLNGGTVSGNVDAGVYDESGRRLVSTGSTAQATINAPQLVAITLTLHPGTYFLAIAMDNTTGTLFSTNSSLLRQGALGQFQQATAFPLPATATFARVGTAYIPCVGLTTRSFV